LAVVGYISVFFLSSSDRRPERGADCTVLSLSPRAFPSTLLLAFFFPSSSLPLSVPGPRFGSRHPGSRKCYPLSPASRPSLTAFFRCLYIISLSHFFFIVQYGLAGIFARPCRQSAVASCLSFFVLGRPFFYTFWSVFFGRACEAALPLHTMLDHMFTSSLRFFCLFLEIPGSDFLLFDVIPLSLPIGLYMYRPLIGHPIPDAPMLVAVPLFPSPTFSRLHFWTVGSAESPRSRLPLHLRTPAEL